MPQTYVPRTKPLYIGNQHTSFHTTSWSGVGAYLAKVYGINVREAELTSNGSEGPDGFYLTTEFINRKTKGIAHA